MVRCDGNSASAQLSYDVGVPIWQSASEQLVSWHSLACSHFVLSTPYLRIFHVAVPLESKSFISTVTPGQNFQVHFIAVPQSLEL